MYEKIKVGVLGCADIARRMVIPAILQNDNFELLVVSSRDVSKAKHFAQYFGCEFLGSYEELLQSEVDMVYVPLPTGLHFEWAVKILNQGKHILIEKSIATNYQEAKDIVNLARAKNLLVMENFQFLYHSQDQFIKKLIQGGEIGEVHNLRSSFGFPPFADANNIRYQKELGGGALLDVGAYTIRATSFLGGAGFTVKSAVLNFSENFEVDIFGSGFLVNSEGITSQVAFGFDYFYQCNYEIWGSKGKIISHRAFTAGPSNRPEITLEKQGEKRRYTLNNENHFSNLLDAFSNCVNHNFFDEQYKVILEQAKLLDSFRTKAYEG